MIERLDLPLRDVLRFALPGLAAAAYVELFTFALTGKLLAESALIGAYLVISLLLGLVSFAVRVHKHLPPWSRRWRRFIANIREELVKLSNQEEMNLDENAKHVYKMWLEGSEGHRNLRAHLQYSTGVFYSLASLTMWSALLTLFGIPVAVLGVLEASGVCHLDSQGPLALQILLPLVGAALTWIFGAQSSSALDDLSRETILSMRVSEVRRQLADLAQLPSNDQGTARG